MINWPVEEEEDVAVDTTTTATGSCKRCHTGYTTEGNFIVGKKYPFSCKNCGLVQMAEG